MNPQPTPEQQRDFEAYAFRTLVERGKCLLHIWSQERNIVREVVDSECKNGTLRLAVRKFAQSRPHKLQICRDRDLRTAAARKTARTQYARMLERILQREFAGWTLDKLSTSMNLERSFSPVYTRGLLRKGHSSLAVLGVNGEETQASTDAALTFGLLWLAGDGTWTRHHLNAGGKPLRDLQQYLLARRGHPTDG